MKAFYFRLQRVLQLRETEVKTEEAKLEYLYSERTRMESERDALNNSVDRMSSAVRGQQFLRPSDLVALDQYKEHVKRELVRFAQKLAAHETEIEKQRARVTAARARVKLLEKLREKRHNEWGTERDRELEELAADFSTAQWLRER